MTKPHNNLKLRESPKKDYKNDTSKYNPLAQDEEPELNVNNSQSHSINALDASFNGKNTATQNFKVYRKLKLSGTESQIHSPSLSTHDHHFRSINPPSQRDIPITTQTHDAMSATSYTVKSIIDKHLSQISEKEIYSRDKKLGDNGLRIDKKLKDHYSTYKSNVFNTEDRIFNMDRNLISRGEVMHRKSPSKDFVRVKQDRSQSMKPGPIVRRCINTAAMPSRTNLKPKHGILRINTSGSVRKGHKLGKSHDYNARMTYNKPSGIQDSENQLQEIMNYQNAKTAVRI
jgi:hypothetical protein